MRLALPAAVIVAVVLASPVAASDEPTADAPPSYLFEWITHTGAALRRLTLFTDSILVRKTTDEQGKIELKKRKLSDEEYAFYAKLLKAIDGRAAEGNFETGIAGDRSARSVISIAAPESAKWSFSFDAMSSLPSTAADVRAALDGLMDSFGKVLPNESDFSLEKLKPGTVLRRRDGTEFRVVNVDDDSKVVEMRAVGQPYSQFFEWKKLRFTFFAP